MDNLDVEMQIIHGEVLPDDIDRNASFNISENTDELDLALIKYITQSKRILFLERENTWNDFQTVNEKFDEFTMEQLYDHFQRKVLPNIYNYELTPIQKQMLELLSLHPEYERVTNGYQRLPAERRLGYDRLPKEGQDFVIVEEQNQLRQLLDDVSSSDIQSDLTKEFDLTKPSNSPTHTLLLRCPYERKFTGYGYQFSKENAALLSAALSNDFELSGRVLIEPRELHARLRSAKRNFEQYGNMPENCLNAAKLLEKIKKLKELREAIVDVVADRF
ncbi:uncharacterized protein LOC101453710 [Ceratitis capitata]|uniref:uncharacterized protein LOC101453710 n=1 Tax=Ceratitis capitata TaxID=7213 RepID=UPI000329CC7C|nr:uncharacterized protein LOC101453710 [Ceratitis capitata]